MHSPIQLKIIAAGVRNLHEFGYPDCDSKNILTDRIYAAFFDSMLQEHNRNPEDVAQLRKEIAEAGAARDAARASKESPSGTTKEKQP